MNSQPSPAPVGVPVATTTLPALGTAAGFGVKGEEVPKRRKVEAKKERGLKELPDGRWQWSYYFRGRNHRHIAATKTEARMLRETVRAQIRAGVYAQPKKEVTEKKFNEAVDEFLKWSEKHKRPRTHKGDKWCAAFWKGSRHLGGKILAEITGQDVKNFREDLLAHKIKNGTRKDGDPVSKRMVDMVTARLKRFFNLCVEWEHLETSPAAKIKLFREDSARVRYLTEEEEKRIMEATSSDYLKRIVQFALNTGARRAEILGLRWQDIDFPNRVATIPAIRAKGRRDRALYLNETAVALLEELPRPLDRTALVFGNSKGKYQQSLERLWRHALTVAKIEDFHFHDLRHTYASRLVMAGVELSVLRECLGHKDFTMTLRYAHLQPSRMKAAVAILDSNVRFSCNPKNEAPEKPGAETSETLVAVGGVPGGS